MLKSEAQTLVQQTLQGAFDKTEFVKLVANIFKRFDPAPSDYRDYDFANSIQLVGKYQTPDTPTPKQIDILIIRLEKGVSLARARTKQRNLVAEHLKRTFTDAALVAFVAPDSEDWRFSLVKMEYKIDDSGKVREEFTTARRYSFLVGENENTHTAQSQLVPVIERDDEPTLTELEAAFSVEPVTTEFFEKYRDLYLMLKKEMDKIVDKDATIRDDFKAKQVDTVDFSKKLLGQIVFLYFLQRKGWFGVQRDKEWGSGSKKFLRELFKRKHGQYENFFNDILEPLFYEALRLERPNDYYNQFRCRIPYLNGGLFNPLGNYDWWRTDILLPDEIFSNERQTKGGDTGDGILDIFDRYNFTVKEDEPLEKEVAVDPEMLGKVFENLLPVKDRKSEGTYYTPREIVHYMCQESLINYLVTELGGKASKSDIEELIKYSESTAEHDSHVTDKGREADRLPTSVSTHAQLIDDKLATIRVCDPAVGSGAFAVGMMNEIVRTRGALAVTLGEHNEAAIYQFKRHAIQNCLYGVDKDSGAVEIAKLRLWLSLVVDEERREEIQPLPNLEYKIVQGNSLYGMGENVFNSELLSQVEKLKLLLNNADPIKTEEYSRQIEELLSKITDGHKKFYFKVYFSEIFSDNKRFDIVIGNPPYGFRNVLTAEDKKYFRKTERIEFSSGDSAELFSKKSFDNLVAENGMLTFIIPKKSLYGDAWEGWRTNYLNKYKALFLLDASKAFENVLLEQVAFGLVRGAQQSAPIALAYLTKTDEIKEFANEQKPNVFMRNKTIQIYSVLYDSTFKKIQTHKNRTALVEGELGLAIGQGFFSDEPTDYELLKGIDIARWRIKQHRYLKNRENLKWDDAAKFLRPKVICQRVVAHIENPSPHLKITACYDESGTIIANTLTAFRFDKAVADKFWLAYLNSSFVGWYAYNFVYSRAIRGMDLYNFYIQQIPIPKALVEDPDKQQPFIDFVNKILTITRSPDYSEDKPAQAKVREYETQIDNLVYDLYDLTAEERAIVEGGER